MIKINWLLQGNKGIIQNVFNNLGFKGEIKKANDMTSTLYYAIGYIPQIKNKNKLNFIKDVLEYHNIKLY